MGDHSLSIKKENNIIIITIDDSVDNQDKIARLAYELTDLYETISQDRDIRVMVLTGSDEQCFAIGIQSQKELQRNLRASSEPFFAVTQALARFDMPIIAAINGDALGQSLEVSMACDIRIASDSAKFGLPQVKWGFIPWDGGTQRLSRLVGQAAAMEMILTGKIINAREAFRIGLVNRVLARHDLMPEVIKMAHEMALKGPIALKYSKEAVNKGMDLTLEQGLRLEADLYYLLHTTEDRTEGITKFLKKENPQFKGQ